MMRRQRDNALSLSTLPGSSEALIDFEGRGLDARVQVRFASEGTKWLALQYAMLTAV